MDIRELIKSGRVYLDGAIGTRIIEKGIRTNEAEKLNVTNPTLIEEIHESYFAAGANAVFTNTFSCNSLKYDKETLAKTITAGIRIAKRAASRHNGLVAYSAGPLSSLIAPYGTLSAKEAYALYAEQAEIVKREGVDFVAVETMTDLLMARLAVLAFKDNTDYPIFTAMSFDEKGRTFNGSSAECFAITMSALSVDALGTNCGLGADKAFSIAEKLLKYSSVPVYVKPNAGLPVVKNGVATYDMNAEAFSDNMKKIAELGVGILGGCCGTDGEYIRKTVEKTRNIPVKIPNAPFDGVCSAVNAVDFSRFRVIGERLNPTGKKKLKEALIGGDYEYVKKLAAAMCEDGAEILDVNAGIVGIDEAAVVGKMVECVGAVTQAAVQIDSANVAALESALYGVAGVPIINSTNGERDKMERVFALAKRHGAFVVCLCLDENGIPESADGRVEIAKRIVAYAESVGVSRGRLLVDPLVCAVAAGKDNARITLEAAKRIMSELNVKCVLGLSNVSFGLPRRELINGAFLSEAKRAGVIAAIVNPSLSENEDALSLSVIRGEEGAIERFISEYGGEEKPTEKPLARERTIKECILKGLAADGRALCEKTATAENYSDIIEKDIIGGLDELGAEYEKGKIFLPQLISGSDAAREMLDFIKSRFIAGGGTDRETLVFATVFGDVHDIGKNIVKAVLENYGYNIVDLGRNVQAKAIVEAVEQTKARFVGLSALMTTTLESMKETTEELHKRFPTVTVLCGGAVVTKEFAQSIGAVYCRDASETARILASLTAK